MALLLSAMAGASRCEEALPAPPSIAQSEPLAFARVTRLLMIDNEVLFGRSFFQAVAEASKGLAADVSKKALAEKVWNSLSSSAWQEGARRRFVWGGEDLLHEKQRPAVDEVQADPTLRRVAIEIIAENLERVLPLARDYDQLMERVKEFRQVVDGQIIYPKRRDLFLPIMLGMNSPVVLTYLLGNDALYVIGAGVGLGLGYLAWRTLAALPSRLRLKKLKGQSRKVLRALKGQALDYENNFESHPLLFQKMVEKMQRQREAARRKYEALIRPSSGALESPTPQVLDQALVALKVQVEANLFLARNGFRLGSLVQTLLGKIKKARRTRGRARAPMQAESTLSSLVAEDLQLLAVRREALVEVLQDLLRLERDSDAVVARYRSLLEKVRRTPESERSEAVDGSEADLAASLKLALATRALIGHEVRFLEQLHHQVQTTEGLVASATHLALATDQKLNDQLTQLEQEVQRSREMEVVE